MTHDDRFVITFFAVATANQNQFEIALAIKIEGMVEAGFQHYGRGAIGLNLITQHDCKIGGMKIIV